MVPSVVVVKVTGHRLQSPPLSVWRVSHPLAPSCPHPRTRPAFPSWICLPLPRSSSSTVSPNPLQGPARQPLTRAQGTSVTTSFNVIHSYCGKTDAIVGEESFLLMRKPQQPSGGERPLHRAVGTHPEKGHSWGRRMGPWCPRAAGPGRREAGLFARVGPVKDMESSREPSWPAILPPQ